MIIRKTTEQIDQMAAAGAIQARCLKMLRSKCHPGVTTAELDEAVERYSEQVSAAVASDPDTAAYVEQLEERADDLAAEENLPSGESLAAELTRYLRERRRHSAAGRGARPERLGE